MHPGGGAYAPAAIRKKVCFLERQNESGVHDHPGGSISLIPPHQFRVFLEPYIAGGPRGGTKLKLPRFAAACARNKGGSIEHVGI
jgi:hypothetical protein